MANKEHLEIIGKGVHIWNDWRENNPAIKPDLREAYLRGKDLSGFNLSKAYLCDANLMETDLMQANLSGAYLFRSLLWKGTHPINNNYKPHPLIYEHRGGVG